MRLRDALARSATVDRLLSALRARQQERSAARSAADYARRALRAGLMPAEGRPLERELRERIARRRPDLRPKRRGDLHVFLAFPLANWEAVLPLSLEPFGRVSVFEWRGRGFDDGRPDWVKQRDAMNVEMLRAFHAANAKEPVDAVVGYLSGHNTAPATLSEMARTGSAVFNFSWDDKLAFPGPWLGGRFTSPAAIAGAVDLNLTNSPSSLVKYAVHGGLAMFWPEAALPATHRPYDVPFEFDVTFVGANYGWRPRFIARLRNLGIRVQCFGRGWEHGPLSPEEMVRLYSRSRINLGFAGVGRSRKLLCLKGRDFEVPMSGGLYLTQNNPELSLVYDLESEIVTYVDEIDCAQTIRLLLADESKAAAIRAAGRRRALRDHTYEARWATLFETAGLMNAPPS